MRHMTLERLSNALLLLLQMILRTTHVSAKPIVIKIEPTNICNFRCPGCRTGSGKDKSPRGIIKYEDFCRIVDQTYRHAFKVFLYMWGEPLIHPEIFHMVKYAAGKNLAVQISSNLNIYRQSYADQMVDSGLEHLVVAMDGVSQEIYEKYRVGGQIQKVIDNVRAIIITRNKRQSRRPFVELQFIVFPHNRHELHQAQQLAGELGADRFTVIDGGTSGTRVERSMKGDRTVHSDKCNALWIMACFNWDGSFFPCCDTVDDSFGNVLKEDFVALWNNVKIMKSRSLFSHHKIQEGPATKCSRCRIYGSRVLFIPEEKAVT
jgi:MoaA/NifB/PqqE/SkfB family radical SAM enzyme